MERVCRTVIIFFFFFWKILFSTVYPFSDGKGHNVYRCTQPNEAARPFVTTRLKKNRNSDRLQSHASLPIFGSNYAARRRAFGSVQTAAIGVILMSSRRPLTFRPSTVTTRTVRSNFPRSKFWKDKFHLRCHPVVYVRGLSACGFHCIFFNYNYIHNPRNGTIKTTIIRPPRSKRTSRVPSSAMYRVVPDVCRSCCTRVALHERDWTGFLCLYVFFFFFFVILLRVGGHDEGGLICFM